jgi:hypothetical protein
MNYKLHGNKFFTHPGVWASVLYLATLPPLVSAAPPGGVTLNSPSSGDTLNSPATAAFTWSQSDPAATWFLLTLTKDGGTFLHQWTPTNHFTAVNGLPGGSFTWTIQTWNPSGFGPVSGPSTFTVVAGSPAAVTLISPVGTVETNSTIPYTWTQDPSSTWYELFVNKDGRLFLNRWFGPSDVTVSAERVTVTIPGHTSGNYTWWVRPWGPDGLGPWSSNATFAVHVNGEPGPVTLLTPPNGSTAPVMTTLTWSQTDPAAEWFLVWVNHSNTTFFQRWVQTNSFTFTNGLPSGDFTWWVRPWNTGGLGAWSSTSAFTVNGGAVTNPPTLISPVGGTTVTNSTIAFTWTADPNATWFQLFVNQNGQVFLNRWLNVNELTFADIGGVNAASISIPDLPTGTFNWWVRGWSPDGMGPWSDMATFIRTTQ